jgi:hypothetical protein
MRKRGDSGDELTRAERRRFEELVHAYYELDAVDLRRSTGSHVIAVPSDRARRRGFGWRRRR